MEFLGLNKKTFLVFGLANRKSVAWHVGRVLTEVGAKVLWVVRSEARRAEVKKLTGDSPVFVCDVENEAEIAMLKREVEKECSRLDGLVHSIAFAEYEGGVKPFHETGKREFLRAVCPSCPLDPGSRIQALRPPRPRSERDSRTNADPQPRSG